MSAEPAITRQVLFFGDSHVAGVGDEAGLGWVGRVAAASFEAGRPFIPYNLGVGGNTSVDVLTAGRSKRSRDCER